MIGISLENYNLSSEIIHFINENISSVAELEVLFTLVLQPGKAWDAKTIAKELRSNSTSAGNQLSELHSKKLIQKINNESFQYIPQDKTLDDLIKTLRSNYIDRPVAIITCIYEKPSEKLKVFSDAFKLKKD